MRRTVFCIFAAVVAGFGLATVLALGTAAVSAALYKSQAGPDVPVYTQVQATGLPILIAGIVGFTVGAGVIVWMFATANDRSDGPEDTGYNGQSEV